jgi:hypothetical protein
MQLHIELIFVLYVEQNKQDKVAKSFKELSFMALPSKVIIILLFGSGYNGNNASR